MNAQHLFEAELRRRGLPFQLDPSGRYSVETPGGSMLISLTNLARDLAKDSDPSRVIRFVDAILATKDRDLDRIKADQLYWTLEPADHHEPADFRAPVSDCIQRVLASLSNDRRLITWVIPSMLQSLALTEEAASAVALKNLAVALAKAELTIEKIDGVPLAILGTKLPFKAALILAPNLRAVLEPALGWPLMAVIPDRDFLYLWPAEHRSFAGRLGQVVVNEFSKASYPLSTEVFHISDAGVEAIGAFPVPNTPQPQASAPLPNMKTIRYRGGLVTFQIPKDWREEYEEDGGGTFYQPGDDTSTLRLNVLTFKTPSGKPVTPDSVILFLDPSAKKRNTKVIPLRPGLAYIRYDDSTTEAGQPITIRTWQLAQMVPPDHARIFVFTYTHLTSHFNTRATTTELALLEHSITICQPAQ